jgi:tetratricopeptide (TPR) repeat protein
MNDNPNKSIIRINNLLNKTYNAIFIANKLANNGIEQLFNEAFYLLNSSNFNREAENFYFLVHNKKDYLKSGQFKYEANPHSNYEKAKELLQKAIELDRTSKYCYLLSAISKSKLISLEQTRNAIEDCSKAIEIDHSFVEAYVLRGYLKYEVTDYEGSLIDYDKAIEIDKSDSDIYYKRGDTNRCLEKYDKAMLDYSKAIEINPSHADAFEERAGVKLLLNDFKGSLDDFSTAHELSINTSKSVGVGYFCRRQAMFEYYFVEKINELKNKFGNSSSLIKLLEMGKKHELKYLVYEHSPELKYKEAIAKDPNLGFTYICLANFYLLDDPSTSNEILIDNYTKAIELYEYDVYAYLCRGDFYYEIKDYEKAIKDFKKAIEIEPNNSYAYFSLFLLFNKLGDVKNSDKNLFKYKELINANRSRI